MLEVLTDDSLLAKALLPHGVALISGLPPPVSFRHFSLKLFDEHFLWLYDLHGYWLKFHLSRSREGPTTGRRSLTLEIYA